MKCGDDVKIRAPKSRVRPLTGLDAAFEGATGYIVGIEGMHPKMYRVRLNKVVEIPNIGTVRDDLWSSEYLKKI